MTEREAFLRAIDADRGNTAVRLVYADWLDDNGEHEEAEQQRKWVQAMDWLEGLCQKFNEDNGGRLGKISCEELVVFGLRVSTAPGTEFVLDSEEDANGIPNGYLIATAIRDQIPEFWRAWSVLTGLPLAADLDQKSYIAAAWECCPHEVFPERHVAGPKPVRFSSDEELEERRIRESEAEEERRQREEELEIERRREDPLYRIQDNIENGKRRRSDA